MVDNARRTGNDWTKRPGWPTAAGHRVAFANIVYVDDDIALVCASLPGDGARTTKTRAQNVSGNEAVGNTSDYVDVVQNGATRAYLAYKKQTVFEIDITRSRK